jgi:hypothetical protein
MKPARTTIVPALPADRGSRRTQTHSTDEPSAP